jgi:DNA-binding MarR family transcriptional regulator
MERKELVNKIIEVLRPKRDKIDKALKVGAVPIGQRELIVLISYLKETKIKYNLTQIAQLLNITKPAITQKVAGLIKADLVIKTITFCPRKEITLSLSPKGEQYYEDYTNKVMTLINQLIDEVGEEQMVAFTETVGKIKELMMKFEGEEDA